MIFNVERGIFYPPSILQFYQTQIVSYISLLPSAFPLFSFSTFFSSHLPCPTLFARDPILFSPTGNTILTRSEVQLTMEDRSSHFSRKIHRERLKKMSLFRKVYIWYNSKSMDWYFMLWFGIYRFSMGCKLHWRKKNILFWQNVTKTKIKRHRVC